MMGRKLEADIPADKPSRPEDIRGDDQWMFMHKRFLVEANEQEPEVLFIGDFLVALAAHTEVWEKHFAPLHCLNFGITEDQTQNVLWRIENGEIDSINPKVIVLSVGSNNIAHKPEDILSGIRACVTSILKRKPNVTLVVLKLLPCGRNPNPLRTAFSAVNESLKDTLKEFSNTQVVDIDPGFVLPDGTISHHDMYDYVHLTRSAYKKSFEILADLLQQILLEGSSEINAGNFE